MDGRRDRSDGRDCIGFRGVLVSVAILSLTGSISRSGNMRDGDVVNNACANLGDWMVGSSIEVGQQRNDIASIKHGQLDSESW